jgi:8-oxo-dGTP pyrophosphatase MutT (NUDIX family)
MGYIEELRALVGHRPLILVGVLVMVFDEQNRLLLQHRIESQTWDFPGGFMELGETTEETARREVREETGLTIGELTLIKVFSGKEYFYECPNGDQVFPVCPVYVTYDAHGTLCPDGREGSDVKFFPVDQLPSEMIPDVKMIIEDFIQLKGVSEN